MEGKKRQRPVTSCLTCRKRRLKCDRVHPMCGRCRAGGTECVYDESALARASTWQSSSTSQLPSSTSTTYGRLEGPTASGSQVHPPEQPLEPTTHERGHISVFDGGRSAYVGSTYWANAIPRELSSDAVAIAPGETSPFPKFPSDMDSRNFDWAGQKFRPPRSSQFQWMKTASNKCKLCGRNYNISCVTALLPGRDVCEKLCGFFFATVFPLVPIFHNKSFADDFRSFWDGVNAQDIHNSEPSLFMRKKPAFLSLLSAILFAALSSASPARLDQMFEDDDQPKEGDMYFIAMASSALTGFPRRPSIYSLAAYIIAQSQFVREEEFSDAPDFIATSFRVALGMGLHRHLREADLGAAELETRRRLWWYILHLDVMSSASSGLSPLFINQRMANTDAICQYDPADEDAGARQEVDIRYLVASHRYAITKEMREILVLHFEDAFQNLTSVEECAGRLRTISGRTSATVSILLQVNENADSPSTTPRPGEQTHPSFDRVWSLRPDPSDKEIVGFSAWSALLLHLMVHKAYCVLYHPLFRDPLMVANENIRLNAVKHAQAFVQLFIRVCNDPISEPYHWMYPGTYQPLQAVSLLLADLLQHPHSDDANLSRGLIDAIFDLYHVDEGIVSQHEPPKRLLSPSGRDAWTMLVRTRQRALQQVGMDHHVLFPSKVITSNRCICGEKISVGGHDHGAAAVEATGRGSVGGGSGLSSQLPEEMQEDQAEQTPGQMLYDPVDFDWHAWDNALGPSVGLMP